MPRRLQEDVIDPNCNASRVYYQYPDELKINDNIKHVVVHDDENDEDVHFQNPDELDTNDSRSVVVHDDHPDMESQPDDFYPPVYPNDDEIDLDKKPNISNPVDNVKANPANIPIGQRTYSNGTLKFFIDGDDVIRHAEINNESVIEAFDNIIACNESNGVDVSNTFVVMNEYNIHYAKAMEDEGINCMEFVTVKNTDPSINVFENYNSNIICSTNESFNPIEIFKSRYDSIPIAMDENMFFADVEDICKCASVNNESINETVNGIIDVYESSGMNIDNFNIVVSNCTDDDIVSALEAANIRKTYRSDHDAATRRSLIDKAAHGIRAFLRDGGCLRVSTNGESHNKDFINDNSNTMEIGLKPAVGESIYNTISYKSESNSHSVTTKTDDETKMKALEDAIKIVRTGKTELIDRLQYDLKGYKVTNVGIRGDGYVCVFVTIKPPENIEVN